MNANHGREILFGFAEEMIHENHSKYLALSHLVISNAWDLKASQLDPRMGAYNEGDNEIVASATTTIVFFLSTVFTLFSIPSPP